MSLFVIYKVPTYKVKLESCKRDEYEILSICEKLKIDNCYHERLFEKDLIKLNIDLDGENISNFKLKFSNYFSITFKIKLSDSDYLYTTNFNKKDSDNKLIPSHHVVIRNYHCNSLIAKHIFEEFKNKYYLVDKNIIDTSHLGAKGSGHWFRLPNQTKEGKLNTEHKIINGELEDFVLKFIPSDSINLDNFFPKTLIEVNSPNEIILKPLNDPIIKSQQICLLKIEESLNHFSPNRANSYNNWVVIIKSLHTICKLNNIPDVKRNELIHKFSKLYPKKYNNESVSNYIELLLPEVYEFFLEDYLLCLKKDNLLYYNIIFKNVELDVVVNFNELSDDFYANLMLKLYFTDESSNKLKLLTTGDKIKEAYQFNGIYWTKLDFELMLVYKYFKPFYNYLNSILDVNINLVSNQLKQLSKSDKSDDFDEKLKLFKLHKKLILKNLLNTNPQTQIVKQIQRKTFVSNINWNNNSYIVQFDNLCYDLSIKEFIPPNSENFINISIGYDYFESSSSLEDENIKKR